MPFVSYLSCQRGPSGGQTRACPWSREKSILFLIKGCTAQLGDKQIFLSVHLPFKLVLKFGAEVKRQPKAGTVMQVLRGGEERGREVGEEDRGGPGNVWLSQPGPRGQGRGQ